MNSELSRYIEKFNAIYYPIKDRIGNIGVIVAGFALAVLSFFVRTDIFGFLLDFFGVIGILAGIVIVVIGVFMLGLEEGWWKALAAFNKQPADPAPQNQPPTAQRAEAQSAPQQATQPEPAQQPEYPESQEAGTYYASAQEQYAPASYQPQQVGFRMPEFLIRMRGNILIAALTMFLAGFVLDNAFTILTLILLFIPFTISPLIISVLGSIIPNLLAGGLGGIIAGNARNAIYAALLCLLLAVVMNSACVSLSLVFEGNVGIFNDLEFWIYFLIGQGALIAGTVIGSKIMAENFGMASDGSHYMYDEYQGPYR